MPVADHCVLGIAEDEQHIEAWANTRARRRPGVRSFQRQADVVVTSGSIAPRIEGSRCRSARRWPQAWLWRLTLVCGSPSYRIIEPCASLRARIFAASLRMSGASRRLTRCQFLLRGVSEAGARRLLSSSSSYRPSSARFRSWTEARVVIATRRRHYNEGGAYSSLGSLTPAAFAARIRNKMPWLARLRGVWLWYVKPTRSTSSH